MLTIAIPQLYCGASGQRGAYNRQEVGLARAFAALGARAVVLYPVPGADKIEVETPAENVKVLYCPAKTLGVNAFYKSWQPLLDEKVDAVHVMGDNSLAVPGLYRFCRAHGIFFYSQLGALASQSQNPAVRRVMDLFCRRNLAIYRRTPTYAKTQAVADELEALRVPCAGVLPVGLDTAIIPEITEPRAALRRRLGLDENANYLLFVGRLDAYKRPLDVAAVLAALPETWQAVVIGQGSLAGALPEAMQANGLQDRWRQIPQLPNAEVLEAMYAGCVPVARCAPGPDMIVEDGVSGFLVEPGAGDTAVLAKAVRKAAEAPAMADAAKARIRSKFLWRNSAETALAMLQTKGVNRDG